MKITLDLKTITDKCSKPVMIILASKLNEGYNNKCNPIGRTFKKSEIHEAVLNMIFDSYSLHHNEVSIPYLRHPTWRIVRP